MIRVRSIQTGYARLRPAHARRRLGGAVRVLLDRDWTEWLPIHAWLIEHPEGSILVDTGECAKIAQPGYLPGWHPFFRLAASFQVEAGDELGMQLRNADRGQRCLFTYQTSACNSGMRGQSCLFTYQTSANFSFPLPIQRRWPRSSTGPFPVDLRSTSTS
jgi:hypothetical protein